MYSRSNYFFIILIINLILIFNLGYGINNKKWNVESKAIKKLISEILTTKNIDPDKLYLNDQDIINSIVSKMNSNHLKFFCDGVANDITKPYDDSTDYAVNISDNYYTLKQKKEAEELFKNYIIKTKEKKDNVIELKLIPSIIKVSFDTYYKEYLESGYFLKVYQHLESKNKVFVQIDLIGNNELYKFYLVYNDSNKFQYYFIDEYRD